MSSAPFRLAALALAGSLSACTVGEVEFAGKSCTTDEDCAGLACLDQVCGGIPGASGGSGGRGGSGGSAGAGGTGGTGGVGGQQGCTPACAPGTLCRGDVCEPGTISFDPPGQILSGTVRLAILAPPGIEQGSVAATVRLAGQLLVTVELIEQAPGRYEGDLATTQLPDGAYDLHAEAGAAEPPVPVQVEIDNTDPVLLITVQRPQRPGVVVDGRLSFAYTLGAELRITGRLTEQHPGPVEAVATLPGGITSSSGPTDALRSGEFELLVPTAGLPFDAGEAQVELVVSTTDLAGHTTTARGSTGLTRLAFRTPALVPLEPRLFALREDDASLHASAAAGLLTLRGPGGSHVTELAGPVDSPAYSGGLVISPRANETRILGGAAFAFTPRCFSPSVGGTMIGFGPSGLGTRYYAALGGQVAGMAPDCVATGAALFPFAIDGGAVGSDDLYVHVYDFGVSSLKRLHDSSGSLDELWDLPLPEGPGTVLLSPQDVIIVGGRGLVGAVPRTGPPERFLFDTGARVTGAPILAFGSILIPVDGGVRRIDPASGAELAMLPLVGSAGTIFAGADGLLYVEELLPEQAVLHALDPAGTERWSIDLHVPGPTFPVPGCDGVVRLKLGEELGGVMTGAAGVATGEPWPIERHDVGRTNGEATPHPACP